MVVKLEVDFLGANDGLRIRHAYLTYGDWLVGQTWSNFAVPDYMPETIDALGYVGGSCASVTPQVRYTQICRLGNKSNIWLQKILKMTVQTCACLH